MVIVSGRRRISWMLVVVWLWRPARPWSRVWIWRWSILWQSCSCELCLLLFLAGNELVDHIDQTQSSQYSRDDENPFGIIMGAFLLRFFLSIGIGTCVNYLAFFLGNMITEVSWAHHLPVACNWARRSRTHLEGKDC